MKHFALLFVIAVASCAPHSAFAQSVLEARLLSDYGWHGVSDGGQINQPTLAFEAPIVQAWERTAVGGQYGVWLYAMLNIDCEQWTLTPMATLDGNHRFAWLSDMIGEQPATLRPKRGQPHWKTMTALCGLYGYQYSDTPTPPPGSGFVIR